MRKTLFTFLFAAALPAFAQLPAAADWATHALNEYQVIPNVTYLTASNWDANATTPTWRAHALASVW
jgi:hypothetical protein